MFELCNFESVNNFLGITLKIVVSRELLKIFNVYGPQINKGKELWRRLSAFCINTGHSPSLFLGDFNCSRSLRK